MSRDTREGIVRALSAESSDLRTEGVRKVVDFVFDQKLAELVDFHRVRELAVSALTEENVARVVTRHVRPGWKRYLDGAARSGERVGDLVPDASRPPIVDIVASLRIPRSKWTDGAVDPVLFRKLFAPVFAQVLWGFAKRMPLVGTGAAAAASGAVGREAGTIADRLARGMQKSAERLVDKSRSVMGGLGAEMEKRLQGTVREFSEASLEIWRDALRERLKSDDGRKIVRQILEQATGHVMGAKLADVHVDAHAVPVDEIMALSPAIVAQAAQHPFVVREVSGQLDAFLALEGARTVREFLEELGIEADVRAEVERRVDPAARRFFQSPAFSEWLDRLLDAAADDKPSG
jgi:hypothetical protein